MIKTCNIPTKGGGCDRDRLGCDAWFFLLASAATTTSSFWQGASSPRVSRTAAASTPQQSTTPFLCLLAGGQHTDALAKIVAFVHGIKRGHADMDAALKGSLGLICKATQLAVEGALVVYSLPDADLVRSSSSSQPSKAKKRKTAKKKPPRCSP